MAVGVAAEVKNKLSVVDVIGETVQLKKAGSTFKGLCPFHGEKSPSFNVAPDKGFFYCFGCQKKGDVFTFIMEYEGKSFVEAAEALAELTGVALPERTDDPAERRLMVMGWMPQLRNSCFVFSEASDALFDEKGDEPDEDGVNSESGEMNGKVL